MRVHLGNDPLAGHFAEQILQIGNGLFPKDKDNNIVIPPEIATVVQSKKDLIERVFPDIGQNFTSTDWLTDRAILAPLNKNVDELNHLCQSQLPGNNNFLIRIDKN